MANRLLGALFVAGSALCATYAWAQDGKPTRAINLVYDDSGSMIRQGDTYVDTWCQAKYALEAVAAMLDEGDALNVYYMSDYDSGMSAPPRVRLRGSQNPQIVAGNVETIHRLVTPFGNTPFAAVKKAHQDLKHAQADERWLVVLTDGEFEDGKMAGSEVEKYFHDVVAQPRTNVIMLAMGPIAAAIQSDEPKGIYFEHAASTRDILPKLTSICNRIFQRNILPVQRKNEKASISFAVPMKEIVVLGQGANVRAAGPLASERGEYKPSSAVHVRYSEISSAQNPPGAVVATGLNGIVATYYGPFAPGTYQIDLPYAENIDVYYKPNVSIAAYLFDPDGNEVTDNADIVNGKYTLKFGFVDAQTREKAADTALLGKIDYKSTVRNAAADGSVSQTEAKDGDAIEIREGKLDIDVTARYLDYNTVKTALSFDVFFRNTLAYTLSDVPDYRITDSGFENLNAPMRLKTQMKDGENVVDLSPEEWAAMSAPKVYMKSKFGNIRIQKTDEPGVFELYPTFDNIDPFAIEDNTMVFAVSGGFEKGKSSAAGRIETSIELKNDITDLQRAAEWIRRNWQTALAWLIVAVIAWGYMPWVKRRFKKINRRLPADKKTDFGTKKDIANAKFEKDIASVLLPYCAETGKIKKLTTAFPGVACATMELKAGKNGNIFLMNFKKIDKKIEIDSRKPAEHKGKKPFSFRTGATVSYKTENENNERETYTFSVSAKSK